MMIQGHIEPEGDAWQAQVQIVKEPASAMRIGGKLAVAAHDGHVPHCRDVRCTSEGAVIASH